MGKRILSLILLLLAGGLAAQNSPAGEHRNYYYAGGERIPWTDDSTSVNLIVGNMERHDTLLARAQAFFTEEKEEVWAEEGDDNIVIHSLRLPRIPLDSLSVIFQAEAGDILFASHAKRLEDGVRIWLRNEVMVKYKDDQVPFPEELAEELSGYDLYGMEQISGEEYSIFCRNGSDVEEIANRLHDTGRVVFSTPDFFEEWHPDSYRPTDPLYGSQYYLDQSSGMDINAPEAWEFVRAVTGTLGSPVKVAVLDAGVESHEDMYAIDGTDRVLQGYTANGDGTGRPLCDKCGHGQCCAGIIAASHNAIGISGIAPNARIVPIRIIKRSSFFSHRKIAESIRKAWQEFGAVILSDCQQIMNSIQGQ